MQMVKQAQFIFKKLCTIAHANDEISTIAHANGEISTIHFQTTYTKWLYLRSML